MKHNYDRNAVRGTVHKYQRDGYSVEEIASLIDEDESFVRELLAEKTKTEQRREAAQKLRDEGLSDVEISGKLGFPDGQVRNLIGTNPKDLPSR
jgi:arsenate reductase-like glutaredoxin family protein